MGPRTVSCGWTFFAWALELLLTAGLFAWALELLLAAGLFAWALELLLAAGLLLALGLDFLLEAGPGPSRFPTLSRLRARLNNNKQINNNPKSRCTESTKILSKMI